jgi:peptidoglycan/LPS O-acetylase OafA/YrhL
MIGPVLWRVGLNNWGNMTQPSPSLDVRFNPRRNSLNALRLVLATLVIVSHSWPVGGYGADPGMGDQDLGDWAVAGFFAISGYLITMSRMHSKTLVDYFWRRFLRIYPAFLTCIVIVAFVFAPLSVFIGKGGSYSPLDGLSYVAKNLGLFVFQIEVPGTLQETAYPGTWNGPLWTLFYEFVCYIGIGVLVSVVPRAHLTRAIGAGLILCTLVACAYHIGGVDIPDKIMRLSRLGAFFCAGAVIYQMRQRIPLNLTWSLGAAALALVTILTGTFQVFAGLPVAYLMMALAVSLPFPNIGATNDISYGMYIYAFPVQQSLALAFPEQTLPVTMFVIFSITITLPLAWGSWLLVEKPCSRMKGAFKSKRRAASALN